MSCAKSSKGRIVIFVDDLDRLEPARAVEVMEAIKVFLDVKGCVFVLAVDFNVVKTGVRSKYVEIDDQKVQHIEEERINARQLEGPFLFEDLLAEYGDFKTALQPSRVQDWILEYEGQRFGILNVNKIKGFKINIEPTLFVAKGKEEAFSELLNRLQTGPEMMNAQKMTTAKYGSRENQVKIMVSDLKIGVDNQLIEEIASALGEVFGENM